MPLPKPRRRPGKKKQHPRLFSLSAIRRSRAIASPSHLPPGPAGHFRRFDSGHQGRDRGIFRKGKGRPRRSGRSAPSSSSVFSRPPPPLFEKSNPRDYHLYPLVRRWGWFRTKFKNCLVNSCLTFPASLVNSSRKSAPSAFICQGKTLAILSEETYGENSWKE